MRLVPIEYRSLDLYVRFDRDDGEPTGIFAFAGKVSGKDTHTDLDEVFSAGAVEEIHDLGRASLAQVLEDEAAERQDQIDACWDTPYQHRMAA